MIGFLPEAGEEYEDISFNNGDFVEICL